MGSGRGEAEGMRAVCVVKMEELATLHHCGANMQA